MNFLLTSNESSTMNHLETLTNFLQLRLNLTFHDAEDLSAEIIEQLEGQGNG